jgi:hypothetical protein
MQFLDINDTNSDSNYCNGHPAITGIKERLSGEKRSIGVTNLGPANLPHAYTSMRIIEELQTSFLASRLRRALKPV